LDVKEAYTYYEEKSPGLGERFLQVLIHRYNVSLPLTTSCFPF